MNKFLRAFVLFAAIVGLMTAAGVSSAPAQVKDKDKKVVDDKKKVDDKKTAPADELGKIEVYMAKDGWRFKVMNTEGKSIAIGTVGFDKKEDALKTLELLKTTLNKVKPEVREEKK